MGYNVSYLCRIKFKFKRRNCIMIRKISSSDYLKRLDNMNGEERQADRERVGKWLRDKKTLAVMLRSVEPNAQLQNVPQCSTGWNDAECQAFDEGAVLLTAVVHQAETWLPDMLYVKAAKRCIRRMHEILKGVCESEAMDIAVKEGKKAAGKREQNETGSKSAEHEQTRPEVKPAEKKEPAENKPAVKTTVKMGGANTVAPDAKSTTVTKLQPVRPKHIDQYVHLLPQKTQERAAQVKDLLRELDETREKMRLLMEDKTASAADREAWAKKATSIDNKIRKIYDELDAEWDKLVKSGRVVVDDLGNAHIVESPAEDAEPQPQELTSEQKKQRKALRKWLLDTRYGKGDKLKDYQKRWQEKFKEYAALDGTAYTDEKILAAAKHYKIDITKIK